MQWGIPLFLTGFLTAAFGCILFVLYAMAEELLDLPKEIGLILYYMIVIGMVIMIIGGACWAMDQIWSPYI